MYCLCLSVLEKYREPIISSCQHPGSQTWFASCNLCFDVTHVRLRLAGCGPLGNRQARYRLVCFHPAAVEEVSSAGDDLPMTGRSFLQVGHGQKVVHAASEPNPAPGYLSFAVTLVLEKDFLYFINYFELVYSNFFVVSLPLHPTKQLSLYFLFV